jgi:hypothetical protein
VAANPGLERIALVASLRRPVEDRVVGQGLSAQRLLERELLAVLAAIDLPEPAAALGALDTSRVLDDSVERDVFGDDDLPHHYSPTSSWCKRVFGCMSVQTPTAARTERPVHSGRNCTDMTQTSLPLLDRLEAELLGIERPRPFEVLCGQAGCDPSSLEHLDRSLSMSFVRGGSLLFEYPRRRHE